MGDVRDGEHLNYSDMNETALNRVKKIKVVSVNVCVHIVDLP